MNAFSEAVSGPSANESLCRIRTIKRKLFLLNILFALPVFLCASGVFIGLPMFFEKGGNVADPLLLMSLFGIVLGLISIYCILEYGISGVGRFIFGRKFEIQAKRLMEVERVAGENAEREALVQKESMLKAEKLAALSEVDRDLMAVGLIEQQQTTK